MPRGSGRISDNSRRIARNTFLLYFRMLLLMLIGLFTSRVVLSNLGIEDYGVYNAVGGMVVMFTFITSSMSSAISRYMAVEIERGDRDRLRRVFSTGVIIQMILCVLLAVLVEVIGQWFLTHKMVIPEGRMGAARIVLHCSLGVLVINMLSVSYNAAIIAREKMSAFAFISILEAVLKLSVALILSLSVFDKLETYAFLMLIVALVVRLAYGIYCSRHFEESRGRIVFDGRLLREMFSFAGWNFFGSGAYVLNTQGVNLIVNIFFGVTVNAARGIASQVEGIVKQFVSNFLTAVNPQITKSWTDGNREYCFELVRKGAKFSYLVILVFLIPVVYEPEFIVRMWLGRVPDYSTAFVSLSLVALAVDITGNTLLTLVLATGRIRRYYLVTGLTSLLCLPGVWFAFRSGASPVWAYGVFIIVYALVFVLKFIIVHRQTGFPAGRFVREVLLRLALMTVLSGILPGLMHFLLPSGLLRFAAVCLTAWASMLACAFSFVLSPGERAYILHKPQPWMPDRLYLEAFYYRKFGRVLDLRNPSRYTEKIQWQKLYDHNPLYHTLADKAAVKGHVASLIGEEHVVPTLGVWDSCGEIDWDSLPERFVLKCTHDSGSVILCRDKSTFDREAACAGLGDAMRRKYYRKMREWAYRGIRPRVMAEPFLEGEVNDYKFFCFNGTPELMFVATDRFDGSTETKFDFFDMEYRHLDLRNGHPNAPEPPAMPRCFGEMKRLAGILSQGIPQVRVDFYEVGGRVYFGEYTFYHWGGFMPFDPDEADYRIGELFKL